MTAVSRRSLLAAGAALPVAGLLGGASRQPELKTLESEHKARLGVYAVNTRTGATVAYRADERFAFCSTFKTLPAAAILRDKPDAFLATLIPYTATDLVTYSPITENHVGKGMRVDEICAAAIQFSDNTAGNLMLRQIGGPAGVTRFCRSLGDPITRQDRWETALNSAIPGDPQDTSTPRALGTTYRKLLLGDALSPAKRQRLRGWLLGNTTSANRFGAGLPAGWLIADKTGSGSYATGNDAGVAWTGRGTPILITVLTTKDGPNADPNAAADEALVAEAARIVARTLAPGE